MSSSGSASTSKNKGKGRAPSFRDYLYGLKKRDTDIQTHTWFRPGYAPVTLSVPPENAEEFLEKVYTYITETKPELLENPERGDNSITEKVPNKGNERFRFFVDLDFKVNLFEKHEIPTDEDVLKEYMSDLVKLYDSVIEEIYGIDYVSDRILAIRLWYKLHIIYPSVIVNGNIANLIAERFSKKLATDERFATFADGSDKIVDVSVYSTGLRMVGMHKSTMGKTGANDKIKKEMRAHEEIFGDGTYVNCYKIVDVDTFEPLKLTFELYTKSSIMAAHFPSHYEYDYTQPLTAADLATFSQLQERGRGKGKKSLKALSIKKTVNGKSVSIGGSKSGIKPQFVKDTDTSTSNNDSTSSTVPEESLTTFLSATVRWLHKTYNHVIDENKIMYASNDELDDPYSNNDYRGIIVPLLESKECPFENRSHANNNQYILVDNKGSRQRCHDCKKQDFKPRKPISMPMAVKNELIELGIFERQSVTRRTKTKELNDDEKINLVAEIIHRATPLFPRNDLSFSEENIQLTDFNAVVVLNDSWCELCSQNHDVSERNLYLEIIETGKVYLRCRQNRDLTKVFPEKPLQLDLKSKQGLFPNAIIQIEQDYKDRTGDVPLEFDVEPFFEDDEEMNHLMYESLSGNTWGIVKLIHHVGKKDFACTKRGEWYKFSNHRWHSNCESEFIYFVSDVVTSFYRRVRDYYKENTESPELRTKRQQHVQRLIDKLSNSNPKQEIIKESKVFFYVRDNYLSTSAEEGEKHFEDQLDENKHLIGFNNGVYDLNKDEFRPGEPHDFITLSVGYDHPGTPNPEKRALLERFVREIQPEEVEREYLLLFCASLLHGFNKEETVHTFTGSAANGKSLLRDLLMFAFGEYCAIIPANLLTKERPGSSSPQPDIVQLKGRRIAIGSEPEANQKLNTGFVKYISGNDPLKVRNLYSNDPIEFFPQFKLILLTNDIPLMDNNDNGIWRRFRIVEFPVVFTDKPRANRPFEKQIDESLKEKMPHCRQDFMLILLDYYKKYKLLKRLRPTVKVNKMVESHKKKSNPIQQYIEEQTEECDGHGILISELYPKYVQWMRTENPGETPVSKQKLVDAIQKMQFLEFKKRLRVKGRNPQYGIKGRRYIEQEAEPDHEEEGDLVNGLQIAM